MTYDQYLVSNLLMMNALLAFVAGVAAWRFARILSPGWVVGILGFPFIIFISTLLSAINVLVWLSLWSGGDGVLRAIYKNPGAALDFFLEMAIDFGLIGIGIASIMYVVSRIYDRRARRFAS
ncbi:hypothetical protein V5F59_14570 [Xanthobacter autotrophicus DSM 431]|uniref:hypothetical protein n=1 Tax=Xanthobacter nonsaccharivorans TaxID=3119912 RepID=UPI0037274EA7